MSINNYEEILFCDFCGSTEKKIIDRKGNVIQCNRCGLKFVTPRPKQKDISEIYNRNYNNCPGWGEVNTEARLIYERRFNFVEKFIKEGKILDVGAGRGEFLSMAKRTNRWQCFGTETSQYAVEFTKDKFDIGLSVGQLENLDYQENFFDVVCFWHVLEHLPYPSRAIKKTMRILKDSGFLFIAVPNDSWLGRSPFFKNAFKKAINRLPLKKKLKLKKMYPEINEEGNKHLFYFTPRTLIKLLKKHNFQIREHSIDYDYEKPGPKIEKRYKFNLIFCRLTGINLSNAILIAAQKK